MALLVRLVRLFEMSIAEPRARQADRRARAGLAKCDVRAANADRCRYAALAEVEAKPWQYANRSAEAEAHQVTGAAHAWRRADDDSRETAILTKFFEQMIQGRQFFGFHAERAACLVYFAAHARVGGKISDG